MTVGEWDRRELCPDGSCTGLIGPEGTCKVCGHVAPNWGDERKRGVADDEEDDDGDEDDDDIEPDPIAPAAKAEIGAWSQRSLCPDGGCIGVIGSDGTCKVCGKTGVPGAADDDEEDDDEYEDDEDAPAEDAVADYEDEEDEGEDDEDEDDELAAAADELAGVAPDAEVARASDIAATATGADEDDRKLCPDGNCIGLIGDNGTCKVCGKEAAA